MIKIGCVILNYAGAEHAIEAHASLSRLAKPDHIIVETVIVDNCSPDDSLTTLNAYIKTTPACTLISLTNNVGFAKGNNVGIKAARENGCDFVVCLNNDIVVPYQESFWQIIVDSASNQTAVIGPHIVTMNNRFQNPMREQPMTQIEIEYNKKIYLSAIGKLRYWITMYVLPRLFPRKNVPAKEPCIPMATAGPVYKLHGSFVIFTPLFFKFFDGFDPNTFLFGEETILAEMLRQKNLLAFFQPALNVVHKEDVSTNIYLKGRDKLKFFLKHQYDSYRHLTRAYLCCYEQ